MPLRGFANLKLVLLSCHRKELCGPRGPRPWPMRKSVIVSKYVMGVWSDNFTAAFFVSFIVTVCVHDIEGIQKKVIAYH